MINVDSVIAGFQRLARSRDALDNENETGVAVKLTAKRSLLSRFHLRTKRRLKTDERITSADFDRILDQWMKACSVKGVSIGRMDNVTKEFSKRSKQSSHISKAKPKLELRGCGLNDQSIRQLCVVLANNPLIATLDLSKTLDMTEQSISMLEELTESQLMACQRLQHDPVLLHATLLSDITIKDGTIRNSERLSETCRLLSYENARIKLRREIINHALPDPLSTSDRVKLWNSITDKSVKFLQSAESTPRQDMMTQQESIECIILALIKAKLLQAAPVQEEVDRLANMRNASTLATVGATNEYPERVAEVNDDVKMNNAEENYLRQQTQLRDSPTTMQNESEQAAAPARVVNPFADMAAWLARQDSQNEPLSFQSAVPAAVPAPSAQQQQVQEDDEVKIDGDDEISEADSFFDAVHEQQQRPDAADVDFSFGNFSADEEYREEDGFDEQDGMFGAEGDPFAASYQEGNVFVDHHNVPEQLFEDSVFANHVYRSSRSGSIADTQEHVPFPTSASLFNNDNESEVATIATAIASQHTASNSINDNSIALLPVSKPPAAHRSTISGPTAAVSAETKAIASENIEYGDEVHVPSAREQTHPIAFNQQQSQVQEATIAFNAESHVLEEDLSYLVREPGHKIGPQPVRKSLYQYSSKDAESRVSSRRNSRTTHTSNDHFSQDQNDTFIVAQHLQCDEEAVVQGDTYEGNECEDDKDVEDENEEGTMSDKPQIPQQQYFYEEYIPDFDPTLLSLSIEQQQQLLPDLNEEVNYLAYLQDKINRNKSYAASVLEATAPALISSPPRSGNSSRLSTASPVVIKQQPKKRLSLVVGDRRRRTFHSSLVYGDNVPVNSDDESVQHDHHLQATTTVESRKNEVKLPTLSAARALFAAVEDDDDEHEEECLPAAAGGNKTNSLPFQQRSSIPGSILDSDEAMLQTNTTDQTVTVASWSNRNILSWQQLPLSSSTACYDHLRELDLSHNALTMIDFECLPSNLIKLDLSSNNITSMTDLHVNCKKLKILVLAHNQIKIVDTLPASLVYLDISCNCISTTVAMRALSLSNQQLQFLDVSGNPIVKSSAASVAIRAFLPSLTGFHMNIKGGPNSNDNKSSYSVVQMFAAEHWPRLRHCRATNDIITITCFEEMKTAIQQDILRAIELAEQPNLQANSSSITAEEQRKLDSERSNYYSQSQQPDQDKPKLYDPTEDSAYLHRTKIIPQDVQNLIKRLYHDPIEAEKRKVERQRHMQSNADYAESVRSSFTGTLRTGNNFNRTRASSFMSQRSSNVTVNAENWDDSMSVGASSVRSKSTVRTSVSSLSRSSTVVGRDNSSKRSRLQSTLPRHRLNSQFDLLDHLTSSDNHSRSGRRSPSFSGSRQTKRKGSSLLKEFKAVIDMQPGKKSTINIEAWKEETSRKLGRCAILLHMLTDLAQTHNAEDGAVGGGGGLSHSTLRSMNEEWAELGFLSSDGQFLSSTDTPDFLASSVKESLGCQKMWNKLCDYRQLFSQLHDALSISIQQKLTYQPLLQGVMSGPVGKRVLTHGGY